MNKKTLIIGIIAIIILGAIGYVVFMGDDESTTSSSTSTTSTTETRSSEPSSSSSSSASSASSGQYVDYSSDVIANTSGEKVLFFHAPWCPQCRAAEASIESSSIKDGVTIIKVDYDSNQDLRQQYDVTIQTTFVKVDDNGNKLASFVAYDEPSYQAVEDNLL